MPRVDSDAASRVRSTYRERVRLLGDFFAKIFEDRHSLDREFARLCEAVIRDGWPAQMARQGMIFGQQTWKIDLIARKFESELADIIGFSEFDVDATLQRVSRPRSIVHIWPALPGAGLTPVLYGALLGVPQWVRPSRRGRNFAEYIAQNWPDDAAPLTLLEPQDAWDFGDVTVVSGSDETVTKINEIIAKNRAERRQIVTGYGHRVSLCVLVDGPSMDLAELGEKIATDTVMWHQMGCFSPRGVLFVGEDARLAEFGALLGEAIAREEVRLEANVVSAAELAQRAQARGVAEFQTDVWGSGVGWVQRSEEAFKGARISTHALSLHAVESLEKLPKMLRVSPRHIQGIALAAPAGDFEAWAAALRQAGATRVCAPGTLQIPPGDWPHDGRPNTFEWVEAARI